MSCFFSAAGMNSIGLAFDIIGVILLFSAPYIEWLAKLLT